MKDEQERLMEIFNEARVKRSAEEREACLSAACDNDAALRRQVECLLQAHTEMGDFLKPPADEVLDEQPGTIIGNYKLLEEIGEGTFGRVFMAEQTEPVQRKVALKVVKPGMDTREVVARFEAERQALGQMNHPNIASVLDGGTTDSGRPFFVMELVDGFPISAFCDKHQLPTGARLRLFTKVCQAVQHAHQKGIIHRDLKPSNILVTEVDGEPVPKIIDFGVAKALGSHLTARTLLTLPRQVIGTPAYMSPEQAASDGAEIDTRSDVYSLGVLLYELLTGATPLDTATLHRAGLDEMRRMIRETEPPKPSTRLRTMGEELPAVARHRHTEPSHLTRLVHGDLDWIAMKALEKDRARRYQTITALAEDIEHHLTSKPVTAGPPGVLYRTRKFVRRHKFGAALSAAAVAAILLSVAALAYGLVQTRQQRDRAVAAEARAEGESQKAAAEAAASAAVNTFLLDDLLGQASPESQPDRDVKLRTLVEQATEKAGERFRGQPLVEWRVRQTLFGVYLDLGELENARRELERLKEICRQQQLAGEHPMALGLRHADGRLLLKEGRPADAQGLYEELLPIWRRLLGPEHRNTLLAMNNLAFAYLRQDKPAEAQELCEELLPILRRLQGSEHPGTLKAVNILANAYRDQGKPAEAQQFFEEVLPLWREVLGPEHPGTLMTTNSLANTFLDQGKPAKAREIYEEILPIMQRVLGPEHPNTLTARNNLALVCLLQGLPAEAQEICEEILPIQRRVRGPEHPGTLKTIYYLAQANLVQGKLVEAQPLFEELLPIQQKVLGPEHLHTIWTMHDLALARLRLGRPAEAQKLFEALLPIRQRVQGPEHPGTLMTMNCLALAYLRLGKPAEAQQLCEEILPIRRRVPGPEHLDTLRTMSNLANAYAGQGKNAEARKVFEELVPIMQRVLGPEHPHTLEAIQQLESIRQKQGSLKDEPASPTELNP